MKSNMKFIVNDKTVNSNAKSVFCLQTFYLNLIKMVVLFIRLKKCFSKSDNVRIVVKNELKSSISFLIILFFLRIKY